MFLLYLSYANAVGFLTTDLFTSDGSSSTDAKTFVNRALTMEINSQDIMVSCFDFSNPNCDESPTYQECFAANQQDFDDCKAYDSWLNSMGYTTDSTPATQLMGVSSAINTCVDARYYKNCDGSGGGNLYGVTQKQYLVFSQRKYDCDSGSPSWYTYDAEGYISGGDYDYNDEISCPTYKKCSEDDDDSYVTTYDGTITNPCRTDDGSTSNYACTADSNCWSNNCDEDQSEIKYLCDSDGSDDVNEYWQTTGNTCGGEGYIITPWYYASDFDCSTEVGAGYVCDADHDDFGFEDWDPIYIPCRKNIGYSCSQTTDCWNDDGGNWCNSISQCTDGANGRACGAGSDCNSGYCCSSTCSATSCGGGNQTDLAILDVIPVQVIPDVDMVKGKSGYVRVIVRNYGPLNAVGQVNVTFDGNPLTPYNPANASNFILNGTNGTFDFSFKPNSIGSNKAVIANVTIVS